MSDYLTWKIATTSEAGDSLSALAYKWCLTIADDDSHRKILHKRIEVLHQKTYKYKDVEVKS